MNKVYTLLFLFLILGGLGYKLLETMLDAPTAFLIAMVLATSFCFVSIKLKTNIFFDTTFRNSTLGGITSKVSNKYDGWGGSYWDKYVGRWIRNNGNPTFFRFRDLNVNTGGLYGRDG